MADQSAIEWTTSTWNPVTGCDRISPGCANCYARTMAKRLKAMGNPRYQADGDGPGFGVTTHPDLLDVPRRWEKPRMVFVNSMSDLFHDEVTDDFIGHVFVTMALAAQHTFQVLTKRPERARELLGRWHRDLEQRPWLFGGSPLPNVWLGVSIENARHTWRADVLRETPAAVRFISAEPLLGSLFDVPKRRDPDSPKFEVNGRSECERCGVHMERNQWQCANALCRSEKKRAPLDLTAIDWLIVGGESGAGAREMQPAWAHELVEQCDHHGVAPFVKQLGAVAGRTLGAGAKGQDFDVFPDALRRREFPAVREAIAA